MLRARQSLDAALKPLVSADWRRVTPDLKDILRLGAYQLFHLERVPRHAAVETSVGIARQELGSRPAGLANAVLRKLAREEPAAGPPGQTHPEWLVQRWRKRFGADRTAALLAHNDRRPPLVIQPARWSQDVLAGALAERGIAFDPVPGNAGLVVKGTPVSRLPGFVEGGFIVQDPAQASVAAFANFPRGSLVWDACAAPGGKAVALSRDHRVIASDIRRSRAARLRETVTRAAPGLPIFVTDARQPPLRPGSMDAVLLDAPCTATGTFARHPDARWKVTERRIATLARLQADLLEAVAAVTRPGGILLYATCSLEPEENEEQVNAFLKRHAEYSRTAEDLFVFPGESGGDGAYAARLERR